MNGFSNDELLAEDVKLKGNHSRFPFPVKVDIGEGETEGLPNRIQNKNTGMWYRFVPNGKYKIGSDQLEDSKEIKVELSSFYISETCVSYGQISKYLLDTLTKHSKDKETLEIINEIKLLPKTQQEDYLLYFQMSKFSYLRNYWEDLLKLTPSLNEEFEKEFTLVASDNQSEDIPEKSRIRDFKLSPMQRTVFKKVLSSLISKLSKLQSNNSPYGQAFSANDLAYTEYCHANLPTEAQWETAASLSVAGKLKVKNMIGNHLEWCSDFYSYDYFKRKKDFKDPIGPKRSKLSKKQLEEEVPVSGLKIITKIVSLNLGVLRGETVSTRHYGILHSTPPANFKTPRMIRLVFNPARGLDGK